MQTGYDLVRMAAERTPTHVALVDDLTSRSLTYRELILEIDVIAAGLAQRGVRAGTRVATILPNLFEHCLALLALQRLAAVPALMNFRLPPQHLATLIQEGEIAAAIIRNEEPLAEVISSALPPDGVLLSVGGATSESEDFAECRADPDLLAAPPRPEPEDLAFVFYTSGTTGTPKGVMIAHRTTIHRLLWMSTQAGLRHGTHLRTLGMMPISHAIGFYCTFLVTLAYNGTFFTMSAFNPENAIRLIETHEITYLFAIPTLYQALVTAPNYSPRRVASLDLVLFGGAPISAALLDRLDREWPATLRHIYGATEIMCGLYNPEPAGNPLTLRPGFYSRVRVVKLGASPDQTVAPGETGELIVDATGDSIFSGYLGRPRETVKKIRDGWYYSGDVCLLRHDGDLDLIGRADDMIRSGGESIYPEEVEALLLAHPSVKEACVIGIPDPLWGELVVACVVSRDVRLHWSQLDTHCRSGPLATFKRPRFYFFLQAVPRNAANKPLRGELRQMAIKASTEKREVEFFQVAA